MSTFVSWVLSNVPGVDEIVDLYFIVTDLIELPITEKEQVETAYHDSLAGDTLNAAGITYRGGRAYSADGQDLGPIGKLVL